MNKTKKIAVITGGTSGIGLATAKEFVKEGYSISVCSIDPEEKKKWFCP